MSDLSTFVFESQQVCFVGTAMEPEWIAANIAVKIPFSANDRDRLQVNLGLNALQEAKAPSCRQSLVLPCKNLIRPVSFLGKLVN